MSIQEATVANALSLSNEPPEGPEYISLAITAIDSEITVQATLGEFKANVNFPTRQSRTGLEIQQSDRTWISLNDMTEALADRKYRVKQRQRGSTVTIEVAWD